MTATPDKTTDPFQAYSVGFDRCLARELAGLPVPEAWTDRLGQLEREAVALSRPAFAPSIAIGNRKRGDSGVYVGRANGDLPASPLANVYRIGQDGDRATVIARYAEWLDERLADLDSAQYRALVELRHAAIYEPVTLVCWCATLGPDEVREPGAWECHAEVVRARLHERMGHVGTAVREAAGEVRQPDLFGGRRQWGI